MIQYYSTINFEEGPEGGITIEGQGSNSTETYNNRYNNTYRGIYNSPDYAYAIEIRNQYTYKVSAWQGSSTTTILENAYFKSTQRGDSNGVYWNWEYASSNVNDADSGTGGGENTATPTFNSIQYTTSNVNTYVSKDTLSFVSQYYQNGILFSKTGTGFNTYKVKTKSAKKSTKDGLTLNLTTLDRNMISSKTVEAGFYDVIGILAYKQEVKKLGGIITARFGNENLFDWEEIETNKILRDDNFSHPYKTIKPLKAVGNKTGTNPTYRITNQRGYNFNMKFVSFQSQAVTEVDSLNSTYATTTYKRILSHSVFSASEVTGAGGGAAGEISVYKALVTYYSTFKAIGLANSSTVEIDSIYIDYTFEDRSSYIPALSYKSEGYTYIETSKNGNRWMKNEVMIHGYSPHTIYFKIFANMICPLTWDSFGPNLNFYKSFFVQTLYSTTGRGATFKPAVPLFNIAENISHIVSDMFFVSEETFNGSQTTTISNQTSEYFSTSASYEPKIGKYKTVRTKRTIYNVTTTAGTEKSIYSYRFLITSTEGDGKATFLETRYDIKGESSGRFSLQLRDRVNNKFNYTSSIAYYGIAKDYLFNFKLGNCLAEFSAGPDAKIFYGFGFWDYTALNKGGNIVGNNSTEVMIYRDNPDMGTINPELQYFFKHTPKVKIGWHNHEIGPITYLGDWGYAAGYGAPSPTIQNLYYEEVGEGAPHFQRKAWESTLSSKRNQDKNLAYFTT